VMNFRDITERKAAEAEHARLQGRLRQAEKMEAVGRLAGGIAHDFNNILGGILGYAEILAENAPAGSPLKRYADNVLTGANRAAALVEQILSYSRSQRGRRVAVDLGWIPWERQIGQSGRAVAPELYLAFGISGASQHIAGIERARTVVAVNADRGAPLLGRAQLAALGDWRPVAEALIERLRRRKISGSAGRPAAP